MLLSGVRNAGLVPLKNPLPPGGLGSLSMELVRPGEASLPDSRAEWAELAGMTPSALSRALRRETSLSFRDWRQVVRLVRALSLLATGASTSEVAAQVGYRSSSHLVAIFRQALGVTPQRYFRPLTVTSRSARAERSGEARAEANPAPVARATSNVRAFVSDEPVVPDGNYVSPHEHEAGELLWSPTGVLTVGTPSGTWVVDAMHGVWLPPGKRHDLLEWGGTRLHYFFIDAAASARLPAECCAIAASEPLRVALLQLCAGDHANPEGAAQALFAAIRRAPLAPLPLPLMQTQRLRPMVALMRQDPAQVPSARRWAQYFDMSPRAFSRQCNKELGAPFGRWRRLMLVRYSVERLRAGDDVTKVASNAGYTNVSMFIAMFRRSLGTTPGRYLALSTSANGTRLSGP
jgi:AraC-like DNA-binding protein